MNTLLTAIAIIIFTVFGSVCEARDEPVQTPGEPPAPDRVEVASNVDGASLVLDEGSTPELVLQVGLPNTCHEFSGYEVSQEGGGPVRVEVYSSRIVGPYACAEIYLTEEVRISLEGFAQPQPCELVTFVINGEPRHLPAESASVPC